MTCQKPGSAANECGAGIASGAKLSFTMDYATGIQAFQEEVANYKSDAAQAGIQLNLVPQSFDTIIGETTPCAVGPEVQLGHAQLRWLELQRPRLRADW